MIIKKMGSIGRLVLFWRSVQSRGIGLVGWRKLRSLLQCSCWGDSCGFVELCVYRIEVLNVVDRVLGLKFGVG